MSTLVARCMMYESGCLVCGSESGFQVCGVEYGCPVFGVESGCPVSGAKYCCPVSFVEYSCSVSLSDYGCPLSSVVRDCFCPCDKAPSGTPICILNLRLIVACTSRIDLVLAGCCHYVSKETGREGTYALCRKFTESK